VSNSQASTGERVVKDTAKQFAAQLIVGAVALAFSAWLNRLLPAKELALWPVCTSLGGVVAACASFGLSDTFVRMVPALLAKGEREAASAVLKTGLLMNLAGCAVLATVVYLLAAPAARYLLKDVGQASMVQSMAFATFFAALAERLNWAMQATQQFGKQAIIKAASGTLRTPLAVGLYLLLGTARGVIVALTIVPIISCVLSIIWLWPYLWVSRRLHPLRSLLGFSLPFYGVSLIGLLSARVNNLVIALLVRPEVLATYFVAQSVANYVDALDRFAIAATRPKLAERNALDQTGTERVFTKCTRYIFLWLLPTHVLVAVAAAPLLGIYGGPNYVSASPVLIVMCAALFIGVLVDIQWAHIQILGKPVHLLALSACQGVENLASLALLVPRLGALGAALSDGVVALLQFVISMTLLHKTMRTIYDYQALVLAVLGSGVAGLVLYIASPLWQTQAWVVLPMIVLAALAYNLSLARRLQEADAELLIRALPQRLRQSRAGAAMVRGVKWLWLKPSAETI
jgi:O-antigen/teichoic acid export membrane protein